MIPEQYNIIWTSSWIPLFPTIEAIKRKQYDLAFGTGVVFLTSINYWRNPIDSWRKDLDIFCVRSLALYQLYKSVITGKYNYLFYTVPGIISYYIGLNYYKNKQTWTYIYFHLGLHILANMGNFCILDNNLKTIK
jgi:hypothetical protein